METLVLALLAAITAVVLPSYWARKFGLRSPSARDVASVKNPMLRSLLQHQKAAVYASTALIAAGLICCAVVRNFVGVGTGVALGLVGVVLYVLVMGWATLSRLERGRPKPHRSVDAAEGGD